MIRKLILSAFLFLSCFLFFVYASENPESFKHDLYKLLPENDETGEWKKDGVPQEYKGEDLYLYINGGAEIYHEYGFKQVIIQDFRNKNGKSISLEIFEMEDSESAYGIYTFKTGPEGEDLDLGDKSQLADYYMNIWKGNLLVTLTGFDEDEETVRGLQEIAQTVEAKIKVKGKRPLLFTLLPQKDLIKPSIKYFKGSLGLYNSYPFFTRDVFGLNEAIKGDYKARYSVFIINYENNTDSLERFNEAKRSFKESPRYTNFKSVDYKLFQVTDSKNKLIFVSAFRKCILITVGAIDQIQAKEVFADIQEMIKVN